MTAAEAIQQALDDQVIKDLKRDFIPDAALLAPEPDGIRLPSDASGASNGAAGI